MKFLDFKKLYFDAEESADTTATEVAQGTEEVIDENKEQEKKYTDADLDKIIEKKLAKWQKTTEKKVNEAAKLATMTAQERAEHERDQLQAELDELKRANQVAEMEKTARNILLADGVTVSDAIIANLIADDADKTSVAVKEFSKAFKTAVQEEVKKQLAHKAPETGASAGTLTKSDIMQVKDIKKRQQLIRDNMSLFSKN